MISETGLISAIDGNQCINVCYLCCDCAMDTIEEYSWLLFITI